MILKSDLSRLIQRKRIKKYVYLLKNVLDDELMIIAKLLNIKAKKDPRNEFIEKVEKKYPGIKFSLYKSFETLGRLPEN